MAEATNSPKAKKKRISLSLNKKGKEKDRFAIVSAREIEECTRKPTCKNTDKAQQWALSVFQAWIAKTSCEGDEVKYAESDLYDENPEKVCSLLCKFIVEARQRNGTPYCPKTLLQLATNLQSHALKVNAKSCRFMDGKNQDFQPFHNALNNTSKKLLSEGVGAEKKQARIVTHHEEVTPWERGAIGTHSPIALRNVLLP